MGSASSQWKSVRECLQPFCIRPPSPAAISGISQHSLFYAGTKLERWELIQAVESYAKLIANSYLRKRYAGRSHYYEDLNHFRMILGTRLLELGEPFVDPKSGELVVRGRIWSAIDEWQRSVSMAPLSSFVYRTIKTELEESALDCDLLEEKKPRASCYRLKTDPERWLLFGCDYKRTTYALVLHGCGRGNGQMYYTAVLSWLAYLRARQEVEYADAPTLPLPPADATGCAEEEFWHEQEASEILRIVFDEKDTGVQNRVLSETQPIEPDSITLMLKIDRRLQRERASTAESPPESRELVRQVRSRFQNAGTTLSDIGDTDSLTSPTSVENDVVAHIYEETVMRRLTEKERFLVDTRDDFSIQELAAILGVSQDAAKKRRSRALERYKEVSRQLSEDGE